MKEKRMMTAIPPANSKIIAGLIVLGAAGLVQLFLVLGQLIGEYLVWFLFLAMPSDWMQAIMFTIDPIFAELLVFLVPSLIICLWVLGVERRSPRTLGFYKERAWVELLKGWLVGFLLIGSVVGLQLLTGSIAVEQVDFSAENLLSFVLIAPFWLIQSGTEEILTRGWLFPVVSRKTNLWIGMAVSSLLFAFLHVGNPSVSWISLLNIALFGLLACLYLLKTDNIWGVSAMHAAWNCFQGSFFGLNVSGLSTAYAPMRFTNGEVSDSLSGGNFGPEGSLFASLVMGAYIVYLIWDLYRKNLGQK